MPMSILIFFNSILCISLLGIQFFSISLLSHFQVTFLAVSCFLFLSSVGISIGEALKPAEPPLVGSMLCCHFEAACFGQEAESSKALLEEKAKSSVLWYLHTFRFRLSFHPAQIPLLAVVWIHTSRECGD